MAVSNSLGCPGEHYAVHIRHECSLSDISGSSWNGASESRPRLEVGEGMYCETVQPPGHRGRESPVASIPNQSEISPRRTPSVTASVRLLARSFSRIEAT